MSQYSAYPPVHTIPEVGGAMPGAGQPQAGSESPIVGAMKIIGSVAQKNPAQAQAFGNLIHTMISTTSNPTQQIAGQGVMAPAQPAAPTVVQQPQAMPAQPPQPASGLPTNAQRPMWHNPNQKTFNKQPVIF